MFQTLSTYRHWKRYFFRTSFRTFRCIFQISLKYIKLVISKTLFILVLCNFNFFQNYVTPPPTEKTFQKFYVDPDWFSMQWFLGCCVSNIPSYSAKKIQTSSLCEKQNSAKNNLIGICFSVMHVFYIFCFELLASKSLAIAVFD